VTDSAAPVPLGTLPPDTDPTTLPACWWALLDLHPWEGNPQVHPPAQVATLTAGIRAHGFTTVLQAHWPTCTLIAGHARREALLGLLEEEPEYVIPGSPGPGYVPVRFYGGTWCCGCQGYHPVGEYTWHPDGSIVGS